MEVYVVLGWDHNNLVGVAKDRFAVAKVIGDHLRCSAGKVEMGQHTAKARVKGRDMYGTPIYIIYRFRVYKEEVQVMRPTLNDNASWQDMWEVIDNVRGIDDAT